MIYVSTGGFREENGFQVSTQLIESGCGFIELSAGAYSETLFSDLKSLTRSARFKIHNYFPPPKSPFVLNLASLDGLVAATSLEHVKKAVRWSAEFGGTTYSFHAGFLVDPKVKELGQRVKQRALFDRNEALARFIERVNQIDEYAQAHGVKILIENNVLSANNLLNFNENPFLMADMEECIHVMSQTSSNVELLVDVAHLKVSAHSLGFDRVDFLAACSKWIGGYHFSDNDGRQDSNELIAHDSWFWPHVRRDLDYYSLEVYNVSPADLVNQLSVASKALGQA